MHFGVCHLIHMIFLHRDLIEFSIHIIECVFLASCFLPCRAQYLFKAQVPDPPSNDFFRKLYPQIKENLEVIWL